MCFLKLLNIQLSDTTTVIANQGRTQGEGFGVKPPLDLDILQKLYDLRKGD